MKKILTTNGIEVIVDDQDYKKLSKIKWYAHKRRSSNGFCYRIMKTVKSKYFYMHQEILKTKKIVDHIDRNTLNNMRSNLRICSNKNNLWNVQKTLKKTSSIYKGVTFCKQTNKWISQITHNGKHINLGRFKNEKEAAIVYDNFVLKNRDKYAYLNFKKSSY